MVKQIGSAHLSLDEIDTILHGGLIAGTEPFPAWLNRANQVPMDDVPGKLAAYFHSMGLESLRWEHAGPWKPDARVSVTYLIATLADSRTSVGSELDYLSSPYEWKRKHEFDHSTQKWVGSIWVEYHSAPTEFRPIVLQVLEDAMVGDIPYHIYLSVGGASTDVGVQAKVLTARGVLNIRSEPDPESEPNRWSSCLVVNLPPGELASNPNMPPSGVAGFVAMMLRQPAYYLMKTDVWMRFLFYETLPLSAETEARIQERKSRGKWWR